MIVEIHKLTPELAEDYARFFDETPHNAEFKVICYCVSWRADAAKGEAWPDKIANRRAVAVERVKNGHIHGYLAYDDNKIVGWCNANTKSDCHKRIEDIIIRHNAPVEVCRDDDKIVIGFNFKDGTETLLLNGLDGNPTGEVLSSYLENAAPPKSMPAAATVCWLF